MAKSKRVSKGQDTSALWRCSGFRKRQRFERHGREDPDLAAAEMPAVGNADADDPEFAQLRLFQRATLARLTDAEFRGQFDADPAVACERRFGSRPEPDWLSRLLDCDARSIRQLVELWQSICDHNERCRREYENGEWAAWAAQLQPGTAAS